MTTDGRLRGQKLREAVFAAYEADQKTRRPRTLRPGNIGDQCSRSIWYNYHWCDQLEAFSGRMLRLFETGHQQEGRLLADLRRVGAQVVSRDPDGLTDQISLVTLDGQSKGFLDGVTKDILYASAEWVLTECKTHNKKSFAKLASDGVEVAKPEHYAQMQWYMRGHDLTEALYQAVCKDDDDLYFEFVPYNKVYADRLYIKAEQIVWGATIPAKIHKSPEFFVCRFCKATDVCHKGKLPPRNCRTCIEGEPAKSAGTEAAVWRCKLHGHDLSFDDQLAGCHDHRYRPDLVAGKQIDVTADHAVRYEMDAGGAWEDRGPTTAEPSVAPVTA